MSERAFDDDLDYDALRAEHMTKYTQSLDDGILCDAFREAVLAHDIVAVNVVIRRELEESARGGDYPFTTGEDNPSWLGYLFSFDHLNRRRDRSILLRELKALEDNGFLFVVIGMLIRENYWAPDLDAVEGEDGDGRHSADKAGLLRVRDFLLTLQTYQRLKTSRPSASEVALYKL